MLSLALLFSLPSISLAQTWLPFDQSLPCLVNPISTVEAGTTLDFKLFNSRNSTCKATLNFADPTFLPVTLTVKPENCAGDQFASFIIPCNAPNGTVAVQWQCIGQQAMSYSLLNVTDGTGDVEKFQLEQEDAKASVTCQDVLALLETNPSILPSLITAPSPTALYNTAS